MSNPIFPTGILCVEIAALHRQLADSYEKLGHQLASHDAKLGTEPALEPTPATAKVETEQQQAAQPARRGRPPKAQAAPAEPAKVDPPKAADTPDRAKEAQLVDTRPVLTPEQIAARVKESIVALATKDRVKCTAIVASYGARKFSEIPANKHAEALVELTAALDAIKSKPAGDVLS